MRDVRRRHDPRSYSFTQPRFWSSEPHCREESTVKYHCVVAAALALSGCSSGTRESAPAGRDESQMTREQFEGYLEALQEHDYAGFASYYTDDFKAHIYAPGAAGEDLRDTARTQEMERTLAEYWNWTMDVHQVVFSSDGVAVRATMRGPLLKPWPDSPAAGLRAGDEFVGGFASFYRMRGNKIAELWVVANQW